MKQCPSCKGNRPLTEGFCTQCRDLQELSKVRAMINESGFGTIGVAAIEVYMKHVITEMHWLNFKGTNAMLDKYGLE